MRVAIFGLGEAGSLIAADLARAGAEVHGYDPARVGTPEPITRVDEPAKAVAGAQLVLAITAASDSRKAIDQALDAIDPDAVYADLATAAPRAKEQLAEVASSAGFRFADVALMAPVPGRGLATPSLVSGVGAETYASLINQAGGQVVVVGDQPGLAAARKLLRSIVTKGLTALLIESLEAGEARGDAGWLWEHLVDQLTSIDEPFLRRLLSEADRHAGRRLDEMMAAEDLLKSLGVPADMTRGTIEQFRRITEHPSPRELPGETTGPTGDTPR